MMGFPAVYRFIPFGCTDNERTAAEKGYKTARLEVMTSNSARLCRGVRLKIRDGITSVADYN